MGFIQRAPMVERVLEDMRERILTNEFDTETPLPEAALAERYAVSRGTIRTAVQVLENEGLIIVAPNGRKLPYPVTEKFLREVYETRSVLETYAVKICQGRQNLDSSIIATAFADFYKLYNFKDQELYVETARINTAFHRSIVEMSGNISLLQCWNTLEPIIYSIGRHNYLALGDSHSVDFIIESHRQLMDSILKHDANIGNALGTHINSAESDTYVTMASKGRKS